MRGGYEAAKLSLVVQYFKAEEGVHYCFARQIDRENFGCYIP